MCGFPRFDCYSIFTNIIIIQILTLNNTLKINYSDNGRLYLIILLSSYISESECEPAVY